MWRMGGGVPPKKWNHPHEPRLFVPKGGTVLGNLKAHTRAMQSSRCAGLDRLSLPWCARWRAKGQGQRLLQGWPLYPRGSSGAPLSLEARSRVEEDAVRVVERPYATGYPPGRGVARLLRLARLMCWGPRVARQWSVRHRRAILERQRYGGTGLIRRGRQSLYYIASFVHLG